MSRNSNAINQYRIIFLRNGTYNVKRVGGALMKLCIKFLLSILFCLTFLYAIPDPGETPRDFTLYHRELDIEWNLYDHLDGNTVIFLTTGSFT